MNALVLQTDFGLSDGAVSAMYGVALGVASNLSIYDLTHDIPPFNVWEASHRLRQTVKYWPKGTVFISVVDPGVGSDRRSVVAKLKSGHYVVTPDNGTLTHVMHELGIETVREIDERLNRLPFSGESYTFHGRDVYAFTGARLASGVISFETVGPEYDCSEIIEFPVPTVQVEERTVHGTIDILDVRFGNLWTNISRAYFERQGIRYGDRVEVTIAHKERTVYHNQMTFGRSFADTMVGEPIVYVNSLDCLGVALNQGSFARAYQIGTGSQWRMSLSRLS